MRILIISDYFQPQIGYAKVKVSKTLINLGHSVKILTSDRYFPFHNYESTSIKIIGERIRKVGEAIENDIKVKRNKSIIEFFTRVLFFGIKKEIDTFKPDLILVFGISTPSAIQVALIKKFYKLKTNVHMADSHLPSELYSNYSFKKYIFYYLFRLFFSSVISNTTNKFIALQDKTKDVIQKFYGIQEKIVVIPNGTDTKVFYESKKEGNKLRNELNIPKNAFVLIYTGKIIKEKGVDILIKAFNKLLEENLDLYLMIVGDGPSDYKIICKNLLNKKFQSRLYFLGFKNEGELYKYYSSANLAVWPKQESLAMNDAAACSLPFIANNEIGDKTRISNNNALLYKKDDYLDLAKKIKSMYNNKEVAKKMGENGKKLVIKKLSWEMISKKYL